MRERERALTTAGWSVHRAAVSCTCSGEDTCTRHTCTHKQDKVLVTKIYSGGGTGRCALTQGPPPADTASKHQTHSWSSQQASIRRIRGATGNARSELEQSVAADFSLIGRNFNGKWYQKCGHILCNLQRSDACRVNKQRARTACVGLSPPGTRGERVCVEKKAWGHT